MKKWTRETSSRGPGRRLLANGGPITHRKRKAFGREIGGLLGLVLALLVTIALLVFEDHVAAHRSGVLCTNPEHGPCAQGPKVGEWPLANEFIYSYAEPVREDHRI
jgi:hypothetical protein